MAHVVTDTGLDLGEITDAGQLDYYRREPGFTVDGVTVPEPDAAPDVVEADTDPGTGGVEGLPEVPTEASTKAEWVAYAKFHWPEEAESIDGLTKAELVKTYSPPE